MNFRNNCLKSRMHNASDFPRSSKISQFENEYTEDLDSIDSRILI